MRLACSSLALLAPYKKRETEFSQAQRLIPPRRWANIDLVSLRWVPSRHREMPGPGECIRLSLRIHKGYLLAYSTRTRSGAWRATGLGGWLLRFRTGRLDQFAPEIAFSRLLGHIPQGHPKDDQEYTDEETDGEGDDPELHRVELLQLP